jgi:hypothetical protein
METLRFSGTCDRVAKSPEHDCANIEIAAALPSLRSEFRDRRFGTVV